MTDKTRQETLKKIAETLASEAVKSVEFLNVAEAEEEWDIEMTEEEMWAVHDAIIAATVHVPDHPLTTGEDT